MLNDYNFDIRQFYDNSSLMLFIWNRKDMPTHLEGLKLLGKFVYQDPYKYKVLPMIRPFGRSWQNYNDYPKLTREMLEDEATGYQNGIIHSNINPQNNFEVWLQILNNIQDDICNEINEFINQHDYSALWKTVDNPIWQPLGNSFNECQYTNNDTENRQFLVDMNSRDKKIAPFFLKLIWFQSALCCLKHFCNQDHPKLFDLRSDFAEVIQIQRESLTSFNLALFNFSKDSIAIDSYKFGSSHLAALCLLAILENKLPNGFVNDVTHPYRFSTLNGYLSYFGKGLNYLLLNKLI